VIFESFDLSFSLKLFVIDGYAGWDPKYKKKARVIATRPYHAMFMKQMLMRDTESRL